MRKSFKTKQERSTYQCWLDMKSRCNNPKSCRYYTHGMRGVKVCSEWVDSYDTFLSDMGLKPDGHTLDRIDNDGDYHVGNCKWSTPKEQALNRSTNVNVTRQGVTKTISEWADIAGISWQSMFKRVKRSASHDKIDYPKQERKKK